MMDYAINSMMTSIETEKIFQGDPAYFKQNNKTGLTVEDKIKRLSVLTSTRDSMLTEFEPDHELAGKDTFNSITLATDSYYSPFYHELKSKFKELFSNIKTADGKKNLYTKSEIDALVNTNLEAYKNVDPTDAQVYITPSMFRSISMRVGKWSDEKQKAFELLESDEILSPDQEAELYGVFLQPLKTIYYGLSFEGNKAIPVYDKMSMATLFKRMVKGTEMEKLYNHMVN